MTSIADARPTRPAPAISRRLLDSPPAIPTEVPMRRIGLAVRILLAHFFSEPVAARALIQRRRDAAHS